MHSSLGELHISDGKSGTPAPYRSMGRCAPTRQAQAAAMHQLSWAREGAGRTKKIGQVGDEHAGAELHRAPAGLEGLDAWALPALRAGLKACAHPG